MSSTLNVSAVKPASLSDLIDSCDWNWSKVTQAELHPDLITKLVDEGADFGEVDFAGRRNHDAQGQVDT